MNVTQQKQEKLHKTVFATHQEVNKLDILQGTSSALFGVK
jgi:hypothetical protein